MGTCLVVPQKRHGVSLVEVQVSGRTWALSMVLIIKGVSKNIGFSE